MCLSWCFGGNEEEANAQNDDGPAETQGRKCCISWCAVFAAIISGTFAYYYKANWNRIQELGDAYECEVANSEGVMMDETGHIKVVFQSNYYLYVFLTVACIFSCIGGPLPLCRILSGCGHCVGAFAHVGVLIYTGLIRFRSAKDCFIEDISSHTAEVNKEF